MINVYNTILHYNVTLVRIFILNVYKIIISEYIDEDISLHFL